MKNILIILTAVILINFSCRSKCANEVCPVLDPKYAEWFPNSIGDSIKFRNSAGALINFATKEIKLSSPSSVTCISVAYDGCKCLDCPTPSSYTFFETLDTSRKRFINGQQRTETYNKNSIVVSQISSDQIRLTYYVLDQYNEFIIFPTIQYFPSYSIIPTFTAGSITYSNVIVHQTDTTNLNGQFFVWKSYYNKEKGIIAFEDKKTNSFFYRIN